MASPGLVQYCLNHWATMAPSLTRAAPPSWTTPHLHHHLPVVISKALPNSTKPCACEGNSSEVRSRTRMSVPQSPLAARLGPHRYPPHPKPPSDGTTHQCPACGRPRRWRAPWRSPFPSPTRALPASILNSHCHTPTAACRMRPCRRRVQRINAGASCMREARGLHGMLWQPQRAAWRSTATRQCHCHAITASSQRSPTLLRWPAQFIHV